MKDTGYTDQPDGSWRHAVNIVMDKIQGAITNEGGNSEFATFGTYTMIGSISTTDDRIILFGVQTDPLIAVEDRRSAVFYIDTNNLNPITQTVLNINIIGWRAMVPNIDVNLKFDPNFPILGTYKINAKEELIIYWTDDLNPARCLNVTRQLKWIADNTAGITATGTYQHVYGINPNDTNNKNYIDRLNLFPHSGPVPHIDFKSINSGGGLKTASYYLALSYVDVDNAQTNFVTVDGPIYVIEDSESVSPIERYDGAPPASQTGKSLTWTITNINTDYDYLRPVIIRRMGVDSDKTAEADAIESEKVFQLNDMPLEYGQSGPIELTFTGLEGYTESSTPEIIVDTVSYSKVKTLAQLEGTIYLGNLEGTKDVDYQKYANFIKLKPKTKVFTDFDPYEPNIDNLQYAYNSTVPGVSNSRKQGYRDIDNTYRYKGYTRDEVYAFYIAFILNDGTMSYAYHIPGRKAAVVAGKWENEYVSEAGLDPNEKYIPAEFSNQSKYFHFMETSNLTPQLMGGSTQLTTNGMNYWENANEMYPDTSNFEYWDAETDTTDNTTSGNNFLNLGTRKVRHHHFPSNRGDLPTIMDLTSSALTAGTANKSFYFYYTDIDVQSAPLGSAGGYNTSHRRLQYVSCSVPSVKRWSCLSGTTSCCSSNNNQCEQTPVVGQVITMTWHYPDCVTTGCSCKHKFGGTVEHTTTGNVWVKNLYDISNLDIPSPPTCGLIPKGRAEWSSPATTVSGEIKHTVQALGFELEDIKIPAEIAQKVQGFKIYYAKRKHGDKRILGQNNIIPMRPLTSELNDCRLASPGGHEEDFWLSWPFATDAKHYTDDKYTHFTFHDFNLLRTKNSIAHATHITLEYSTDFYSFRGYGLYHQSVKTDAECHKEQIRSSFHVGANYDKIDSANSLIHVKPLKERCRTYLLGDSIFDGTSLGFGGQIHNINGESSIALALHPNAALDAFSIDNTKFNKKVSAGGNMSYQGIVEKLHHVNLHAFKTDMYNSLDTQELIDTGFEVLGEDLNNFIVGETYNTGTFNSPVPQASDFKTSTIQSEGIFGGDTYICRHGWKTSVKPTFVEFYSHDYLSGHYNIVESTDNINFRHSEGNDSAYFPGTSALSLLKSGVAFNNPADAEIEVVDLTDKENMKYNTNYSELNNVRPAFPLPIKDNNPDNFPTRTHRSATSDPGGLVDNFRVFLANEYKDLPKNRGELWKILSFNNLLYFHMEDTIMKTQGKQTMAMGDGSEAFVGSGDLFKQEPVELTQTDSGYGGTRNQWAGIVTKHGYFFIDSRTSRVFMIQDQIMDITSSGLENWFQRNIPFELHKYGMGKELDNPTGLVGMGFHSVWDEYDQRILLTKREWGPTQKFKDGYEGCSSTMVYPQNATSHENCIQWNTDADQFEVYQADKSQLGATPTYSWNLIPWGHPAYFYNAGWTISYKPDLAVWVSFHDYVPSLWTSTSRELLSILQNNPQLALQSLSTSSTSAYNVINSEALWKHNNLSAPGSFYDVVHSTIFEYIDNTSRNTNKLYSSISYVADIIDSSSTGESYGTVFAENAPGFTSFFVYNTHQMSGETDIEYMMNTRKVDKEWKLNRFRDMSSITSQTKAVNVGPFTSSNYGVGGLNVAGTITTSVELTDYTGSTMFNYQGMHKNINNTFIDIAKPWHLQRRFSDKFLGIRLICSNNQNNLVNLYSVSSAAREYQR